VNIRDVSVRNLRHASDAGAADPVLFDATIRDNLLYGNPGATDGELTRVTGLTELDAFSAGCHAVCMSHSAPGRRCRAVKEAAGIGANAVAEAEGVDGGEITTALDTPTADS